MYILCISTFFILIGLLVYREIHMKNIYKESYKNKKILKSDQKHVIFFGDSILENSSYIMILFYLFSKSLSGTWIDGVLIILSCSLER
jgi:hypothetical protein